MERATLDLSNPKQAHMDARLRAEHTIWLCSVRPDGRPHLVPVWFLWDGETITLFSQPKNQKVRNIEHSPNVILALDTAQYGFDVVQLEGYAEILEDPSITAEMPEYETKYRDLLSQSMGISMNVLAQQMSQTIRVTPTRFMSAQ